MQGQGEVASSPPLTPTTIELRVAVGVGTVEGEGEGDRVGITAETEGLVDLEKEGSRERVRVTERVWVTERV